MTGRPQPAPAARIFCLDGPGPFAPIETLHEFLKSLENLPADDPAVVFAKRDVEGYIRERRKRAH